MDYRNIDNRVYAFNLKISLHTQIKELFKFKDNKKVNVFVYKEDYLKIILNSNSRKSQYVIPSSSATKYYIDTFFGN